MKRWLLRIAAGLLTAVILVAALAWLTLRASLPQLDGEIAVAGTVSTVHIERDAAGIPTISASNRPDLAFATGFVHGQDRYFQMDLVRRNAAGELSAIIGRATLETDRAKRLHRPRSRAQQLFEKLSPEESELLQRYADGVNAAVAALGAKPPEYYLLGTDPEPWRAEDSILVAFSMYLQLNDDRATRDVRRGLAAEILPREVFEWLYPSGTPWDAPLQGEPRAVAAIPAAEVYSLRGVVDTAPPAEEQGRRPLNGSNSWAVSGALTESGRALVANDMHLGLDVPNIFYRARLIVDGESPSDTTGVTLPGQPFVIAGSNGSIAWGFTNSYGDWSDAVLIRPGVTAGTYRTADGDRAFHIYQERIEIKHEAPQEYTVRETIWGPVDDAAYYPAGEIAISWIAHDTGAANLRLRALETAQNVAEALDIANSMLIPPQNFVVGDKHGDIGWTIAGSIPRRGDYDALLPADWSAGGGWHGWLAANEYPRIVNPDSGRIWTANARVVDGEALRLIGDGGYDLGARARQIRDGLFAREQLTPRDMLAIQFDDRALFLAPWQSLLVTVLDDASIAGNPALLEYRRLVADWIPRAAPESVGYRLVRAFRLEVQRRVFQALMAPVRAVHGDAVRLRISNQFEAVLWALVTDRPMHLLPANYDSWEQLLLEAVQENLRYFESNFEGPLAKRNWGEYNAAAIRHPLSRAVPQLSRFLDMPVEPLNGDVDMPKAQGPDFGASERFAVLPGDEASSLMHMPGGQSGHPLSDFYRRGHRDWVEGRPSPFLPGDTQYSLILRPATR